MARSGIKAASESDVTPPGEQILDFDNETLKAIAEVYKNEGNAEYIKKHYSNAVDFYTKGINVNFRDNDLKAKLYSNRAAAHFRWGNYSDSLRDAKAATDLQPSYVKAIITGANACAKLNLFEEAITWCDKGLATDKENSRLLELRKMTCADKAKRSSGSGAMDDKSWLGDEIERGIAALQLSDFKKARNYFELELSKAKDAGDRGREGVAYGYLGLACCHLSDYKTGIEFHLQALSIAKNIGDRYLEGWANESLGVAYTSLGDCKKGIEFIQQALSIAKEVGNQYLEGNAYLNLGTACYSLGDSKRAIELHQQALSIAKDVKSKDLEGKAYVNLGLVYNSLSDFKNVIQFDQKALRVAKEVGNKGLEESAYLTLGRAYHTLGDFNKAIEFHQQGLSVAKEVGNKDGEGSAYNNLGDAYYSLGDFKNSIKFYQQALCITKDIESKALKGNAYMNLGNAYYSLGDFKQAIEFLQQALSIAKDIGSKELEGSAYLNLGNAYYFLGDFQKASEFQQKCLSIAKEVGNKDYEGKACMNLGRAFHSLGDLNNATEFHQQALSIAKDIGNKELEGRAYLNLGCAYESLGDVSRAEDFLKSSVRLFDKLRLLLQSKDEWKIILRNQYDMAYSNLWRLQLRQGKIIEALLSVERGRAQALMDLMESQYGVHSARLVSEEQMETMTMFIISSHIPSLTIFLAENKESLNFWVLQKGLQYQFLEKKTSNSVKYLTHEAYKQIGVFESVMCENRSLNKGVDEESEDFSDRSPTETGLKSSEGKGDALKVLSDVVVGPIAHFIQDDELIIVPDGPLLLVPYAALVDQHSRYLSETVRIRLVPTLTSLKLMAECPEDHHCTSGALLVGDPWVENVRIKGNVVNQLPSAKKEVEMIGEILNIEPLTGKNATKAQVLSKLNSVALIHIAAHGCPETGEILLSPNPASSKTPEAPKEEDYLLKMADVLKAKLQARLVVLSCCHSGRGKIKAEGVVGIARAFLGAGARSVLASLWAIDDDATLEFMRKFYEHLMKDQSASKSLNEAMKWMRESDNFSDVKYWAPFVLIGDDVTLNFGRSRLSTIRTTGHGQYIGCDNERYVSVE